VPYYANLKMTLPANWTGRVILPLALREIRGLGVVRVRGVDLPIGSAELEEMMQANLYHEEVVVLESNQPVELIFLLNPLRLKMEQDTTLRLIGASVASLQVSDTVLDAPSRTLGTTIATPLPQ
jgi:hypothetical protein